MKAWLLTVAIFWTGCGLDCIPSGDIQVTVVASGGVDASQIVSLHILLSLNGGPMKSIDITPQKKLGNAPVTFLLRPDPAPAPKYNVSLTIEGFAADDSLIAIGTAGGDVVSNGCNRLDAQLTGFGTGNDAGVAIDGSFPPVLDMFTSDLLGCAAGGTHDEDQDGQVDSCDVCAADADPGAPDGDADGLPDACDPDVAKPGNARLYFEPFVVDDGQWSGGFPVANDFLEIDTGSPAMVSSNGVTQLPAAVRVEVSTFTQVWYVDDNPGPHSDTGVFVGNSANPGAAGASGMLCMLFLDQQQPGTTSLRLTPVIGGALQTPVTTPFDFQTGVRYRLQLTRRGTSYTCDATSSGVPTTTVTTSFAQAPSGPQFMALHAQNTKAHFHSVFAATTLP